MIRYGSTLLEGASPFPGDFMRARVIGLVTLTDLKKDTKLSPDDAYLSCKASYPTLLLDDTD